jgi:DNA-binding response OmpR family regulator
MIALVVEREWDVRESLKKKLANRGYQVHAAENAEEALNLCIVIDPDLLIASSSLPEMSGFALVERIRKGRTDLELHSIILLDRNETSLESVAARLGVNAVLRKPVMEEKLAHCLDKGAVSLDMGS